MTLNILLLCLVLYLMRSTDRAVATVENSVGSQRQVLASKVRLELAKRHGEDVLGDLTGREMVTLAAEESSLTLDVEEFEARWHLWSQEPGFKTSLDIGEATEEELRSRLTTLVLLDQLSLNDLNPAEKEKVLQRFYETNRRDLEEVRLQHILLDSKKEAEDVAQRLLAGVDFGELARRFSLDPLTRDRGGDLGWKTRDDLSEELGPVLFLIPEGRASRPLSTRHGWHLFLITEKRTEYEDVRNTARRKWSELRRPDTLAELRERFTVTAPNKMELVERLRPSSDPKSPSPNSRRDLK